MCVCVCVQISTDSDHDLDCSRSTCLTPCSSALLYRCSWCSQAVWLLSDKLCTVYSYTCCLLLISNEQMTEPICPVLCRTFWTFLVVAGQQLQFSRRNSKFIDEFGGTVNDLTGHFCLESAVFWLTSVMNTEQVQGYSLSEKNTKLHRHIIRLTRIGWIG